MRRSHLDIYLNRTDLIERDHSRLPRLDEVDKYLCHPVVITLKRADPTRAVEMVYKLVRRYRRVYFQASSRSSMP
jgi:hypothetical protein